MGVKAGPVCWVLRPNPILAHTAHSAATPLQCLPGAHPLSGIAGPLNPQYASDTI